MKKILIKGILFVFCATFCFLLIGCGKKKTDSIDSSVTGYYDLESMEGSDKVTKDSYEFNYIIIKSNGTYETHIKFTGYEEEVTKGSVSYEDSTLTFTTETNGAQIKESYTLTNNSFTVTVKEGSITITSVYTKRK